MIFKKAFKDMSLFSSSFVIDFFLKENISLLNLSEIYLDQLKRVENPSFKWTMKNKKPNESMMLNEWAVSSSGTAWIFFGLLFLYHSRFTGPSSEENAWDYKGMQSMYYEKWFGDPNIEQRTTVV